MKTVDLHVHSVCSDGSLSPTELVDYSIQKGLAAFALTDHDTVAGLDEALAYAAGLRGKGVAAPEVIPGIELSTQYGDRRGRAHDPVCGGGQAGADSHARTHDPLCGGGQADADSHARTHDPARGESQAGADSHAQASAAVKDIHILGLFLDYRSPAFRKQLEEVALSRIQRNLKMCRLLRSAGLDVAYEKLTEAYPDSVITRAHYAKYMLGQGYIRTIREAFERYIGEGCPCYVPREKVTSAQAIRIILEADGIPVLAHPFLYHLTDPELESMVGQLAEDGLLGIEAVYSSHTPAQERQIRSLAERQSLLVSGGSDFHGALKKGLDLGVGYGGLAVGENVLETLRASKLHRILFTDLDGTLLKDGGEISPALKEALDRMTRKGHHLVLASGRPLHSILEIREKLGLTYPGMLVVSYNGALVWHCDTKKKLVDLRLRAEDMRHILGEARKQGLHIHAYSDAETICSSRYSDRDVIDYYSSRIRLPFRFVEDIPAALPQGSHKLLAVHLTDRRRLETFRASLLPYCEGRIQLLFSSERFLEILPAAAGKGQALQAVRRFLRIPPSHTYAAGDAENDISMLDAAHIGIAMQNAPAPVREHARLVTEKDHNHDGLLEVVEKYFL
ncbi:MAG: Cof-type HAD-IIB family hydrolase [Clostridium sp.]|jgi:Cof subfamily protein (haloacid dehalogenase superfamily)|nr:Cof-type HAD-IIB family hydrolase [Clostridium sp.]